MGPERNPNKDPYSLETLMFLEEVLLDVWEGEESREMALSRLRYVCRNQDTDDGYLCYTWGLIEYKRGNYNESYTAFKKALERNPGDSLYKNLLRLSAERSNNLEDLASRNEEGRVFSLFSESILACRSEAKRDQRFPNLLLLSKEGHLTKDMLKRGVISQCVSKLSEAEQLQISSLVKESKTNYSDRMVSDRVKADPFSKVWDTSFYYKSSEPKDGVFFSNPISEAWRKLRSAAKTGNEPEARLALRTFISEIQLAKKKGRSEASLALALERSAKLLLEQDPVYSKVSFLSKEL